MGQDLVGFAAEDDTRQTAATVRGHTDQIALLFLGHGDDLPVDIVALHQRGVDRETRGVRQLLYSGEELCGFGLVPIHVCFRQDIFRRPECTR